MTWVKDVVIATQAASLANENLSFLKKKKKKSRDFVGMGVKNIVGSALLKEQAKFDF